MLQVHRDRTAASVQDEVDVTVSAAGADPLGPVDPDHIGTHVREQLARERPRADASNFDDLDSLKRPAHVPDQTGGRFSANAVAPAIRTASCSARDSTLAGD